MQIEKILIVDDETIMRNFLIETFKRKGMEVYSANDGREALNLIRKTTFDLVITDMNMPGLTGLEVLNKLKEISPKTIVIVITAYGSVDNAVEAMRLGAFHYLLKPFSPDAIETIIDKANEHFSLVAENTYLKEEVGKAEANKYTQCIAESEAMKKAFEQAKQIAGSNANVFISGESGTGKEVIAHYIHYHSQRSSKPFIKVNCAAIPDTLIESEFFGHEKGAFTGANARKLGRFEIADKGTLLLDEVSEIPLSLQAKLLRVTQEQEFERVGGTKPLQVDVRLISTTNRDIKEMLAQHILREDLFYRLNVVPLHLPPLRDRREDILPLTSFFINKACSDNNRELKKFSAEAEKKLLTYSWPGNVRELANMIERAVVMCPESTISEQYLILDNASAPAQKSSVSSAPMSLRELEKQHIIEMLQRYADNKTKTADILGITTRTLRNKLKEYKIATNES
jgi:two-component system, NtrC family, response regulator AtoC